MSERIGALQEEFEASPRSTETIRGIIGKLDVLLEDLSAMGDVVEIVDGEERRLESVVGGVLSIKAGLTSVLDGLPEDVKPVRLMNQDGRLFYRGEPVWADVWCKAQACTINGEIVAAHSLGTKYWTRTLLEGDSPLSFDPDRQYHVQRDRSGRWMLTDKFGELFPEYLVPQADEESDTTSGETDVAERGPEPPPSAAERLAAEFSDTVQAHMSEFMTGASELAGQVGRFFSGEEQMKSGMMRVRGERLQKRATTFDRAHGLSYQGKEVRSSERGRRAEVVVHDGVILSRMSGIAGASFNPLLLGGEPLKFKESEWYFLLLDRDDTWVLVDESGTYLDQDRQPGPDYDDTTDEEDDEAEEVIGDGAVHADESGIHENHREEDAPVRRPDPVSGVVRVAGSEIEVRPEDCRLMYRDAPISAKIYGNRRDVISLEGYLYCLTNAAKLRLRESGQLLKFPGSADYFLEKYPYDNSWNLVRVDSSGDFDVEQPPRVEYETSSDEVSISAGQVDKDGASGSGEEEGGPVRRPDPVSGVVRVAGAEVEVRPEDRRLMYRGAPIFVKIYGNRRDVISLEGFLYCLTNGGRLRLREGGRLLEFAGSPDYFLEKSSYDNSWQLVRVESGGDFDVEQPRQVDDSEDDDSDES
ncbi:hypothetical protein AB0D08_22535 [Kitasatospora sp. NPDC048540]|uniref:hypothetical protein n=1 Tax=Kitasatospora sp. NPDC048540 TaxID=3155634 RepID=UPI00340F574E